LDTRTCLVCAADDGKIFRNLDTAPKLPRHLRDRCLYVPYIKGFEHIAGERAAMNGPVSDKLTYKDWFERQTPEIQEEILGRSRYNAYVNGVGIDSFVSDGRKLTLAELQQKEGLPFYKILSPPQREEIQRQSDTVYNSLTNSQQKSLHDYTTYFHHQINGALYGVDPMEVYIKEKIDNIEASIDKFSVDYNMTLFKGTNKEYYKDWEIGKIYKIDGYVSTSITKKTAEGFFKWEKKMENIPLMLEIRASKGIRGIYIGNNTGFHSPQNEFLLGKGLRYRVIDHIGDLMILEVIK
jgi:hypothetical protein